MGHRRCRGSPWSAAPCVGQSFDRPVVDGTLHVKGIASSWATMRRGLHGTYHHVTVRHLDCYVNDSSLASIIRASWTPLHR